MSNDSEMGYIRSVEDQEWGFMVGDCFIDLPKLPMVRAGHTKPPFDVKLPSGSMRRIISRPKQEATSDGDQ